ncbi:35641_t:CDS:2, partial [Gigaspora margarita]
YMGRRQNSEFIFMGDFNIMIDNKETTEKQKEKNKDKTFLIVKRFGKQDYYNTYRTLNLQELYKRITRAGAVKKWLIDNNPIVESKIENALDLIWEALEKSILETMMKHILKKKIYKTKAIRDSKKKSRLDKLIVELGKWVRKGKKKIGSDMTEEDKK